ncbi:MAG: methyltransferase, partial [Phycisphaerae bacterium]|nr:methyltransferase [Phycisphaerae bacterium]
MDDVVMSDERWRNTSAYIRELFAKEDAVLAGLMTRAVAAGVPAIDAGPESGRVLQMLTLLSGGRRVIEVGTLAGVSAIW